MVRRVAEAGHTSGVCDMPTQFHPSVSEMSMSGEWLSGHMRAVARTANVRALEVKRVREVTQAAMLVNAEVAVEADFWAILEMLLAKLSNISLERRGPQRVQMKQRQIGVRGTVRRAQPLEIVAVGLFKQSAIHSGEETRPG